MLKKIILSLGLGLALFILVSISSITHMPMTLTFLISKAIHLVSGLPIKTPTLIMQIGVFQLSQLKYFLKLHHVPMYIRMIF